MGGVDTDETGRVFVLREVPGTVFVFDPALERLLHVLPLTVEDDPGEQRAWDADENALGEGLLLLRNGHLFVVKEEKPRQLLEFGLPGERAQGLHGDLLIADRGRFPTPTSRPPPSTCCRPGTSAGRRWSGSATSATSPSAPTAASTCSATSPAASPGSRTASRPSGTVAVDRIWGLPDRLHQPEGLVITAAWDLLVATDHTEQRENLFLLDGFGPDLSRRR